jgi:hypothetical protein
VQESVASRREACAGTYEDVHFDLIFDRTGTSELRLPGIVACLSRRSWHSVFARFAGSALQVCSASSDHALLPSGGGIVAQGK